MKSQVAVVFTVLCLCISSRARQDTGRHALRGLASGQCIHFLNDPCTLLHGSIDYEDGSEGSFWGCELSEKDALAANVDFVEIENWPFPLGKDNKGKGWSSGETTFFTSGTCVTANGKANVPDNAIQNAKFGISSHGRHLAVTTGTPKVLVLRVVALDSTPTNNETQIRSDVFNDTENLRSQYLACSNNTLDFTPFNGTVNGVTVHGGVYTISIDANAIGVDSGVVENTVTSKAVAIFGSLSSFQHVMYCLPPGTAGNWISYAYINGQKSVFNDVWCSYVSAQMHEMGHNLNLGHSNEGGKEYADQTGFMGYSYSLDDGPLMCFNPAKMFQLGWYTSNGVVLNPLTSNWSGRLYGVADKDKIGSGDIMYIQVDDTSTVEDFYIGFNRQSGLNSGTQEAGNQVLVVQKTITKYSNYYESNLAAKLSKGASYIMSISGNNVSVTVTDINRTAIPAYADIEIIGPVKFPSKSPAPTATPTTLSPTTHAPTMSPTRPNRCGDGICQLYESSSNSSCPTSDHQCFCDADCLIKVTCGNGVCEGGNGESTDNCPSDCPGVTSGNPSKRFGCGAGYGCTDSRCIDCTMITQSEARCGDGICDAAETVVQCPADCSCGDGICQLKESNSTTNFCSIDCIVNLPATCGNGVCEGGNGESTDNCPSDCPGVTSGNPSKRFGCGAGYGCSDSRCTVCTMDPNTATCGDGICAAVESAIQCPADCA